ncbi:hypothetical protein [Psychrilyobacter atlanticus]|uniref:hypothetical protein n=1 Tax=Psychrilyobacter atlanticus TaxID=271091 RepID=UPI00041F6581|nr:hypothetical protein [Psychrilyobacter atlanticus]
MKKKIIVLLSLLNTCLFAGELSGAPNEEVNLKDAAKVTRELSNPNTSLASLKFKFQYRDMSGDLPGADSHNSSLVLFQPTLPFKLDNGNKILFRPAIPLYLDQGSPGSDGRIHSESGVGDLGFDLVYAVNNPNGILYAGGIIGQLPTGSNEFTQNKFAFGPEVLIAKITNENLVGILPNHRWDTGGSGDTSISTSTTQVFCMKFLGEGWGVGSTPKFAYDWENEQWDVPINATITKTAIINGRPWKFDLEVNYYLEQNELYGNEWMISINVAPVVSNIFETMIENMFN